MERLLDGYRRFRDRTWPAERDRYALLAHKGQKPATLVVACSDSRVDPQTVFGADPGELFVIRNVAALVPPYAPDGEYHGASAALEYGVRVLGVKRIVVLGHAQCGGIQALIDGPPADSDFIAPWLHIADPVRRSVPPGASRADTLIHCETEAVRLSLANLATFPWIAEAVAAGRLDLAGFRFGIATGVLARLDGGRFVPVD